MSDRRLVINLVNQIFTAADRKDWATYRSLLLDEVYVDFAGDRARVTFYEQALHHHPALGDDPRRNTSVLHGRGRHRLRRTGDGWKLIAASLIPVHSTGNTSLIADVAATLDR